MTYFAGRVAVPVVPDFTGFQKSVRRHAQEQGDQYTKDFEGASKSKMSKVGAGLSKSLKAGMKIGAVAVAATSALAIKGGISRLMGIEDARASLAGLGHDAKAVNKIMANALAAVRGTAFGMADAAKIAASSVAAGIQPGRELTAHLKRVADAATIAKVPIGEMGAVFNKVATANKVQGDVINQLNDKGIPIVQLLGKTMGKTSEEITELSRKGEIDFKTFSTAMESGMGGAALKSGNTTRGAFANLNASLGRIGANLLSGFFPKVSGGIQGITKWLGPMEDKAAVAGKALGDFGAKYGPMLVDAIGVIVGKIMDLATAVGPSLLKGFDALKAVFQWMVDNKVVVAAFFGTIATAVVTIKIISGVTRAWAAAQALVNAAMLLNPIGIVIVAIAALVAGLVLAYKKSDEFRRIMDAAWAGIKAAVALAWDGYIKPALKAFGDFITGTLMPLIQRLWNDVIKPTFALIGDAIKFWWNNVVKPIFVVLKTYFENVLFPVLKLLWNGVVKPTFNLIGALIKTWWNGVVKPIFTALKFYFENVLFPIFRFLWNNVIKPVFEGVAGTIKRVWNDLIKPVFEALGSFIETKVAPAFKRGVSAIETAWNAIKNVAKKPVNFVIDTVYNNGLRAGFNKVADTLGLDKFMLPKMAKVGGGGGRRGTGARAPQAAHPNAAMGGVGDVFDKVKGVVGGGFDWVKGLASKGWGWVKDKIMSPVTGALGRVGSGPFGQVAKGAGSSVINGAVDWLKSKFLGQQESGTGVFAPGRVLAKGSYRIGMPYLGYPGHYGSDYPAAVGTPVRSLAGGIVTRAMTLGDSYGKHVYVSHPSGVETRYAHLSSYNVMPGQAVAAGQVIGAVGSTGNSTGPHLHFEYRKNGTAMNPAGLGVFDKGGWLKPGMGGINMSSKPEPVFSDQQWATLKNVTTSALVGAGAGTGGSGASDMGALLAASRDQLAATQNQVALLERQNQILSDMPRDYKMAERQGGRR